MFNLIRRIKNLWELSAYKPMTQGEKMSVGDYITPILKVKKDFPTIRHKLATIIQEDTKDIFEEPKEDI